MNMLSLIGRKELLFTADMQAHRDELKRRVAASRFLVIGGAGSIGQAVTKEIFKRNPRKLHVVDISENNLVELVRDLRSSMGYIDGDFATYALDCGSREYEAFFKADGEYDYILNLSALKHVRSEKDPFTLMRMIQVNVFNTEKTLQLAIDAGAQKYFCVSTDKAANPVNMMGASKRIMEMFLMEHSKNIDISTARFANVAFSDGSLLHGFDQRIKKGQPIVAPHDVRRYFVVPQESGELCLMSCMMGENRDVFFPKLSESLHLETFSNIARRYLYAQGLEVLECQTEDEARDRAANLDLATTKSYPCLFVFSDTTGEKDFEEFYTATETLDMDRFQHFGVIKNDYADLTEMTSRFRESIDQIRNQPTWTKVPIVDLFHEMIPGFGHKETGKYLDSKM